MWSQRYAGLAQSQVTEQYKNTKWWHNLNSLPLSSVLLWLWAPLSPFFFFSFMCSFLLKVTDTQWTMDLSVTLESLVMSPPQQAWESVYCDIIHEATPQRQVKRMKGGVQTHWSKTWGTWRPTLQMTPSYWRLVLTMFIHVKIGLQSW